MLTTAFYLPLVKKMKHYICFKVFTLLHIIKFDVTIFNCRVGYSAAVCSWRSSLFKDSGRHNYYHDNDTDVD